MIRDLVHTCLHIMESSAEHDAHIHTHIQVHTHMFVQFTVQHTERYTCGLVPHTLTSGHMYVSNVMIDDSRRLGRGELHGGTYLESCNNNTRKEVKLDNV